MSTQVKHTRTIIIAGGGTGGHIFPAIAIAKALQQADARLQILFVGAKGKMEMQKIPEAGYKIIGLNIAGFNRSNLLKNWNLPFKLLSSFWQVRSIFKAYKPVAVVGVGGYSTYPVVKWAQRLAIPTFIHESNSHPGKANIWLAQKATVVFVPNKMVAALFSNAKTVVSGNPVRKQILEVQETKSQALTSFNLKDGKPTVLFVGGSLGAASINHAVTTHIIQLAERVNIIWQTGTTQAAACEQAAKPFQNIFAAPFISNMGLAYKAADLVVSRAGAMAVTEIIELAKPSILVPYPFATDDHQTTNAKALSSIQAAWMIADGEIEKQLLSTILMLLNQPTLISEASKRLSTLQLPNADETIAKYILENIEL